MPEDISVLFLGKKGDPRCKLASEFCQMCFDRVQVHTGEWGEPLPSQAREWRGDIIVSYLSRWVVPEELIERSRIAAINFHPAPPDYPGIGCINFALYEGAKEFGATCHHMARVVDTGRIIKVTRFPVVDADTVESLLERTYAFQLVLFYEVIGLLAKGENLPSSTEVWSRKPFTRREFNELFRIEPGMTVEEIQRRTRAIRFQSYRPFIEIEGFRFDLADSPHEQR